MLLGFDASVDAVGSDGQDLERGVVVEFAVRALDLEDDAVLARSVVAGAQAKRFLSVLDVDRPAAEVLHALPDARARRVDVCRDRDGQVDPAVTAGVDADVGIGAAVAAGALLGVLVDDLGICCVARLERLGVEGLVEALLGDDRAGVDALGCYRGCGLRAVGATFGVLVLVRARTAAADALVVARGSNAVTGTVVSLCAGGQVVIVGRAAGGEEDGQ